MEHELCGAPCVNCSSELRGVARLDRQALVKRSDSQMGGNVEGGGFPSASKKGFMDKTRVISLSDRGLRRSKKKLESVDGINLWFNYSYPSLYFHEPQKRSRSQFYQAFYLVLANRQLLRKEEVLFELRDECVCAPTRTANRQMAALLRGSQMET